MTENQDSKQCREEIGKLFPWMKKHKKNKDIGYLQMRGHCNNYSSHCCLSCDRCFGGRLGGVSPLKDKKSCEGK